MTTLRNLYSQLSPPAKRVFWIILGIAVLLTYFGLTLIDTFFSAPNALFRFANALPSILAVLSYVSAFAILTKRINFGAWLFFITTLTSMMAVPFIAEGYTLPGAVLVIVVTILIPLQVFKGQKTTLANIVGLTVSGLMILIDQFYTGIRVPAAATDVQSAQILALILAVVLLVSIVLLYRSFNINTKLLIMALGAGLLAIVSVAGFANIFTQRLLEDRTNEFLMRSAGHTAELIDAYIDFNRNVVISQAKLPIFWRYLQADDAERLRLRPELRQTMREMLNRDSVNIGSYALLDKEGVTVWDTYTQDIGVDKSDRDYFWVVMRTGNPFLSAVRFSPTSTDHGFYISAPVKDPVSGEILGVLRVRFRSSILREIINSSTEFAGEQSYGILLDEYNIILVDAANPDYFGRTPGVLDAATIALLKSNGRLLRGMPDEEISLNMPVFISALRNFGLNPYFT
ncbi:MAG: cache domain-containing protein, partial [Anaerolineales bacterium]